MSSDRPSLGVHLLLLLLAVIWGSSFTIIKVVVTHLPPLSLTGWRIALAALVLAAVAALRGEPWPRGGAVWGRVALAGLTGNVLPFSLISWGEEHIDSGLAAILISVTPITVLVLAHFLTRDERMTAPRVLGVGLGFAGVLVLIGPGSLTHLGEDLTRQLAVLGAAVCYAVNTLIVKRLSGGATVATAAAIMVISGAMLMPVALWRDGVVIPPAETMAWALVLGVVHTGLATLIMFHIVGRAGAGYFAMINFLIPVIGYLLGVALLGEALSWQALASLALILAGILLAGRGRRAAAETGATASADEGRA